MYISKLLNSYDALKGNFNNIHTMLYLWLTDKLTGPTGDAREAGSAASLLAHGSFPHRAYATVSNIIDPNNTHTFLPLSVALKKIPCWIPDVSKSFPWIVLEVPDDYRGPDKDMQPVYCIRQKKESLLLLPCLYLRASVWQNLSELASMKTLVFVPDMSVFEVDVKGKLTILNSERGFCYKIKLPKMVALPRETNHITSVVVTECIDKTDIDVEKARLPAKSNMIPATQARALKKYLTMSETEKIDIDSLTYDQMKALNCAYTLTGKSFKFKSISSQVQEFLHDASKYKSVPLDAVLCMLGLKFGFAGPQMLFVLCPNLFRAHIDNMNNYFTLHELCPQKLFTPCINPVVEKPKRKRKIAKEEKPKHPKQTLIIAQAEEDSESEIVKPKSRKACVLHDSEDESIETKPTRSTTKPIKQSVDEESSSDDE